MRKKKLTSKQLLEPVIVESSSASVSTTTSRRDVAGSIERTDRFVNIDNGLVPFRNSSTIYGPNKFAVDIRDAIVLCQKCYYNFSLFRNTIDLMTEFSVNNIFLRGGSEVSKDFFNALFNKINLIELQDKFFREYYRSGNVFLYRFDAQIETSDIKKITQVFGSDEFYPDYEPKPGILDIEKNKIPVKYIVLNPADIKMASSLNFTYGLYFKMLTDFEILRLRNPTTEEDVEVFNSLPKEVQDQIKAGARIAYIPLDPARVSMVFYKKQDYEPFAVPMGYPVLEDINFKAELRKIDMAIARTMQQIILLVTAGDEPEKGGVNQKNIEALKTLFQNQSVGRVLIADYTTKVQFVIPQIADLLDPKKYETVDKDINIGLNNIFAGSEKFANQSQKVEIFVARLEQGRRAFINNFLLPEIKRISKSLSFKNYPTPYFEDFELKDNSALNKIYARMIEMGILTPEQGFKAITTNTLPDPMTVVEEQTKWKKQRDEGLYAPLMGGGKQEGDGAGRPTGSSSPKKSVGPIGTSKASTQNNQEQEIKFSLAKMKESMILAQELETSIVSYLKIKHNVKRLNKFQKEVSSGILNQIIKNEDINKWQESIATYCENPEDRNLERVKEINKIAITHQLNDYLASLLYISRKGPENLDKNG